MKYSVLRDAVAAIVRARPSVLDGATPSLRETLERATSLTLDSTKSSRIARRAASTVTFVPTEVRGADDGRFLSCTYSDTAGRRAYKLYIPSRYCGEPVPLVVMLHGCTQSPDDFATGTQMNARAERDLFIVAYPEQSTTANVSKCWNWYEPRDQGRDRGEPALIAGITRRIARDYAIDSARIYIAGMSAGGAAAAVVAASYPELYAALGVHSGLACGLAHDTISAFAAMRGESARGAHARVTRGESGVASPPTIIFQGDRDATVHPSNAERFAALAGTDTLERRHEDGRVIGGRAYARDTYVDANGTSVFERWTIHGSGHAWSGGSTGGSYTDPLGPDATAAMIRFFFEHARRS